MTNYSQGEVVLVPFPFTDEDTEKKRPAVIVSQDWYHKTKTDCILVAITSTIHKSLERDEILISGTEVKRAGLLYDSVVKTGLIFTIHRRRIIKPLGHLTAATQKKVMDSLKKVFFDT